LRPSDKLAYEKMQSDNMVTWLMVAIFGTPVAMMITGSYLVLLVIPFSAWMAIRKMQSIDRDVERYINK